MRINEKRALQKFIELISTIQNSHSSMLLLFLRYSSSIAKQMMEEKTSEILVAPEFNTYSSDSEIEQACILVKNLDQNRNENADSQIIHYDTLKGSVDPSQIWEDYWEERHQLKNILLRAVVQDRTEQLKQLLKSQIVDLNRYEYLDGWTLLHHAVNSKNDEVVKVLLENSCSIDSQTQSMKYTALHLAVLQKCYPAAHILLTKGADCNISDVDLWTPMHYVAQYGTIELLDLFLSFPNINFLTENNRRMTPLDCCRKLRMKTAIKEYLKLKPYERTDRFYLTRLITLDKGKPYISRNRSDHVEKFLNGEIKLKNGNKENEEKVLNSLKRSRLGTGTKMEKSKYEKMREFANQIAESSKNCEVGETEGDVEDLTQYDVVRKLGTGSFGQVFLVRKKHSTKLFALKRLKKKQVMEKKMKKYVLAERSVLKNFHHPFIVHGSSFFQDSQFLYIVMEFCPGGDMEKIVRETRLKEDEAKKYCCEVILALQELHSKQYLFRDLKSANVLIDEEGHIKLSDFGLAKQSELSSSFLGSFAYLAPEMLVDTDNKPHTASIDWYLLGVFLYEIILGFPPFYSENKVSMLDQIKNQKPKIPQHLSTQCKDFLAKTLIKNPDKRLGARGANQVKNHAWFQEVDWSKVQNRGLEMNKPSVNWKELRTRGIVEEGLWRNSQNGTNFKLNGWDFCEKLK